MIMDMHDLKIIRTALNLTQKETSDILGCSPQFISFMEDGTQPISLKWNAKIRSTIGVNDEVLSSARLFRSNLNKFCK